MHYVEGDDHGNGSRYNGDLCMCALISLFSMQEIYNIKTGVVRVLSSENDSLFFAQGL